ncbi:hypothetical protein T552_00776 [Pneumocystis carinii B80]|uniref:C2H2-type domain-containing protein n=1 Tax=Pneumocystis carinii (strain B80) TaxID=1408658 RepID=A0A0W4ZPM3_PNEC8|nr:hypothetical protein T552_00776 [Pneumocystis carinii B80]KTW30301.1 hypothetical protein T552_00776 [Pneumocystis carinii B80]
MDASAPSEEYYNDTISGHVLHGRTGSIGGTTGEQRWPTYNRGNLEHKHGPMFEHEAECTTFSGLPPLSQAFNAYPHYPRMGGNYVDTPYSPHTQNAIHLGQSHAVAVASRGAQGPYGYNTSSNDLHGYFGHNPSNEELFPSNPHYVNHPPSTSSGNLGSTAIGTTPPLGSSLNSNSNTSLNSVPSNTATYPQSSLDSRLPMNGQPHRLSSAYSSNLVHPSIAPLATESSAQHFWPNYAMHGHTVADRTTSNNGFRSSSPINALRQPMTMPTGMNLPYKASNKVKQIYSFVPLPGAQTQKRPRRRYDEIERIYQCGWNGCEKAYGTLNHLNAHVFMQGHGEKRTPDEFKEIRAVWRAKKKEEIKKKQAEDQLRQEEQKRHALPSPQLSRQLSSIPESQSHPPNLSHVVYAHLPQPLPNVYPYHPQQTPLSESSHQHPYPASTYHTSLLPHLNQYTAQPQSYPSNNRDFKSHADEEDRDAEGEPDPETSG